MPALSLNGITCPVTEFEELEPTRFGEHSRAPTGRFQSTGRKWKRRWRGRTRPLARADAEAWRSFLLGLGETFTLDASPFGGSRGNMPVRTGSYGSLATWSTQVPWGSYAVPDGEYSWPIHDTGKWTVFFRTLRHQLNQLWVRRSDGIWFRNGVAHTLHVDDYISTMVRVQSSRLYTKSHIKTDNSNKLDLWAASTAYAVGAKIRNSASGGSDLAWICTVAGTSAAAEPNFTLSANRPIGTLVTDNTVTWKSLVEWPLRIYDMMYVPYLVPDSWMAAINTEHGIRAFSLAPEILAAGDLFPTAVRVLGKVAGADPKPHMSSSSYDRAAEAVGFELEEV